MEPPIDLKRRQIQIKSFCSSESFYGCVLSSLSVSPGLGSSVPAWVQLGVPLDHSLVLPDQRVAEELKKTLLASANQNPVKTTRENSLSICRVENSESTAYLYVLNTAAKKIRCFFFSLSPSLLDLILKVQNLLLS